LAQYSLLSDCVDMYCGAQNWCRGLKVVPSCNFLGGVFLFTGLDSFAVGCMM